MRHTESKAAAGMSLVPDQLQTMQVQHAMAESIESQRQTFGSICEGCAAACSSMLQPQSSNQLQDMANDMPDTIARVQGRRSDVLVNVATKFPQTHTISWQQRQHGQIAVAPSFAASELLPQLQLQPQLLQVIKKVVETAVVSAVTMLACSEDHQRSPSAAAAAAADLVALVAQQQLQQDAAALDSDQSVYTRQLSTVDAHACAACSPASPAGIGSKLAQIVLQPAWQQQQLLPTSPVISPCRASGAVRGTAAPFRSSCAKTPAAVASPAPPPPTAAPRGPPPVRRRTFKCEPQFTPAGSTAAATAPVTPTAAGSMMESPWAAGYGALFAGFLQHLMPCSLTRASSAGDIGAYPAALSRAVRRNSSSSTTSSCNSRLSECSSDFASSRSSSDGGSSSSSTSGMPTQLTLKSCNSGHLQLRAAAVSPGQLLLLQSLQLHPPSSPVRQPSPPQDPRSTSGASQGMTSPRVKFICPASPASPSAAAPASVPAGRHSSSRFAPAAPPCTLLQHGACGGAELRASVGRFRRHSTSSSGWSGAASSSLHDGAAGTAASVLDGSGLAGGDGSRLRWSGRSLDGRALGGGSAPNTPSGGGGGDGGGAAAFAAAMAAVAVGATGMAEQ